MSDDIIKRLRHALAFLRNSGATGMWVNFLDLADLLDWIDAVERENGRLQEDADRYRWLRGDEDGRYLTVYAFRTDVDEVCLGEELDATIDAARRKK